MTRILTNFKGGGFEVYYGSDLWRHPWHGQINSTLILPKCKGYLWQRKCLNNQNFLTLCQRWKRHNPAGEALLPSFCWQPGIVNVTPLWIAANGFACDRLPWLVRLSPWLYNMRDLVFSLRWILAMSISPVLQLPWCSRADGFLAATQTRHMCGISTVHASFLNGFRDR